MSTQVPATPELLEELRAICSKTLEIPIEKVTVEADLAADLGADSLTMDELLVLVLQRYDMSAEATNIQISSYPTIGAIAQLIQRLNDEGNGGKSSGTNG